MSSPSSVLHALDQAARNIEAQQRGDPGAAMPSSPASGLPTYGYHNTFHLHAPLEQPPVPIPRARNANAHGLQKRRSQSLPRTPGACDVLPRYTCTVLFHGELGVKCEMRSPFSPAVDEKWHDVYVVLCGTQLNFHRVKRTTLLSKTGVPCPGKLIRSYTLQHAEIGLASDVRKCDPVPRSLFAKAMPANARHRLFETDPHLFEPTREWVIRLRVETEQILLCAHTQERMLSWIERISAAIDISPPLEDRSEPRYRSLPRRSRRQRQLEQGQLGSQDDTNTADATRRLVAEQERIIRRLYPHLAANTSSEEERCRQAPSSEDAPDGSSENSASHSDPDAEDLDREDALYPTQTRHGRARDASDNEATTSQPPTSAAQRPSTSYDPKTAHRPNPNRANLVRFRRRCAPILLQTSPRASEVVYSDGQRMRIDYSSNRLVPFETLPPRYSDHGFSPPPISTRPSMNRSSTDASIDTASLAATSSEERTSFEPPQPTQAPPRPPTPTSLPPPPPVPESEPLHELLSRTTTSGTTRTSFETRTIAGKDLHIPLSRESTRPKTGDGKKRRLKHWGHFIVPKLSPGVWAADCEGGAVVGWVGL